MKTSIYRARQVAKKALPVGSRRRRLASHLAKVARIHRSQPSHKGDLSYQDWIKKYEPMLWSKQKNPELLISVVVPTFNTPDKYLIPLVDSIMQQSHANWQLCIADASNKSDRRKAIRELAQRDSRISYISLEKNLGISDNTNAAIKIAKGDYIGFIDHDDVLAPQALREVAHAIHKHKDANLLYSDEDKLSDDGTVRSMPFFKPDWSPQLLEGVNYMAHFVVIKSSFLKKIGYLNSVFDGAQDYDLMLRATDNTNAIYHIPKVLYHWRMAQGSTALSVGAKSYADNAGQEALKNHVKRRKINAEVVGIPERPTNYRLKYATPNDLKISIIIPFKDKINYLKKLIPSIVRNSKGVNYEVILLSNNSVEQATKQYVKKLTELHKNIRAYNYNKPFNWSAINNYGRTKSTGNILVFLNNDIEVMTSGWLQELAGVAMQEAIGAVGPMLLYPNNTIQHAGVIMGMNTMAGHVFRTRQEGELTPYGLPNWPRNYLAVTGACLVVKANLFDSIGGFDERFIVAGSDVAFCLRLNEKGYHNVYWPFAKLYHYESVSVGSYDNGNMNDYNQSLMYYKPYLNYKDPYFNINLNLMNESVVLREDYETPNQ